MSLSTEVQGDVQSWGHDDESGQSVGAWAEDPIPDQRWMETRGVLVLVETGDGDTGQSQGLSLGHIRACGGPQAKARPGGAGKRQCDPATAEPFPQGTLSFGVTGPRQGPVGSMAMGIYTPAGLNEYPQVQAGLGT